MGHAWAATSRHGPVRHDATISRAVAGRAVPGTFTAARPAPAYNTGFKIYHHTVCWRTRQRSAHMPAHKKSREWVGRRTINGRAAVLVGALRRELLSHPLICFFRVNVGAFIQIKKSLESHLRSPPKYNPVVIQARPYKVLLLHLSLLTYARQYLQNASPTKH